MRTIAVILVLSVCLTLPAKGQSTIPPYHTHNDFLLASPGALKTGLFGYDNPALLAYQHQFDLVFMLSDVRGRWSDFNRWGLFTAIPNFGFGLIHEKSPLGAVTDYRISLAFGDHAFSSGLAYGWSTESRATFNRRNVAKLGFLIRPVQYLSIGLIGTKAFSSGDAEGVVEIAGRPLGNEIVTAFADYAIQSKQSLNNGAWSAGVAVEPLPGIRVTGRYFDTKAFTVGVQLSLGNIGLTTQAHYDQNQKYAYNTYGIRLGAYDRNFMDTYVRKNQNYVEMNLNGPIKYQRFRLFDDSKTLADLLESIDAAKSDVTVAGIAINTSGMTTDREKLWELREKLKDFKTTGKRVVIFIDRGGIDLYHFASIADKIVMDPMGTFFLEGYVMGRTFLKGTLGKIGVGFDEWRFFKYKSAVENFSRDKMSDADREQRQKLVDEYYKLAKNEICEARKMSQEAFDKLVNEDVIFLSQEARDKGLVDTLARWDAVKDIIKTLEGEAKGYRSPRSLAKFNLPPDNVWGEKPRIAVIYALGACAMDEGITARKLVKDVEAAVNDGRIKAIVLRVDSPGGDGLASDYIAEALKKAKGKKPVIVSQGFVAASGGYWLSMYADTIVAAPTTITGSIGVIGGWMYNKGIKEWMGMSTDFVKAGAHADLGFGFTLPLLGVGLPDRNMTTDEQARAEHLIKSFYKEFVGKVASGRKMSYDDIHRIGEGRVWSGSDGKQNGLVDVLGGLETAINIAKEKASIPKEQDVTIVEMPKKGLLDFSMFAPRLFGIEREVKENTLLEQLKFRLKHNGQPLPMLPLEDLDMMFLEQE